MFGWERAFPVHKVWWAKVYFFFEKTGILTLFAEVLGVARKELGTGTFIQTSADGIQNIFLH